MPGSNSETQTANGRHLDERFAAIEERVSNLRSSFSSLEASTARGFSAVEDKLSSISRDLSSNNRTPWIVIFAGLGVLLTFLGIVGGLVYSPISQTQVRQEAAQVEMGKEFRLLLAALPESFVGQREFDQRSRHSADDRARMEAAIVDLRDKTLPRSEWLLHNQTTSVEIADIRRSIEQLRADFGSTYGLRDALTDLKHRLERLEFGSPTPLDVRP